MARVREPRERRVVSARTIALLSPFFRRSDGRQAWVLRLIGGRFGPVLVSEHDQLNVKGREGWQSPPVGREVAVDEGSPA